MGGERLAGRSMGGAPHSVTPPPDALDVAVIVADDGQSDFLVRELQRLRVRVQRLWLREDALQVRADVIYCDYAADLAQRIPWPCGEARAALVVILPQAEPIAPEALEAATPDAVLARPFTANAIQASLVMARSQFLYERRLRGKVDRLEENLRAMRTIERAKSILMTSRSLNADEAYALMRSQAMAKRTQISSIASAIISSSEILG